MQFLGTNTSRNIILVVVGVLLFLSGVFVGYRNDRQVDKVVGAVNTTNASATSGQATTTELETCMDAKGAEVPCLLSRDGVTDKGVSDADFGVTNQIIAFVQAKSCACDNQLCVRKCRIQLI